MKLQRLLMGIPIICCIHTVLATHSILPSIDRIRKKVEKSVSTNTNNFKTILAKAGITNNVVSGHHVLCGDKGPETKELNLADIEKAFDELYWSNQKEFVIELSYRTKQNDSQAIVHLKQKIKEKYSTVKTPLITYAQNLAHEEQQLDSLFQTWLRLSNTSAINTNDKKHYIKKLKELYERHTQLKQTLEELIKITNTLIA
jgi:hypothetical protein